MAVPQALDMEEPLMQLTTVRNQAQQAVWSWIGDDQNTTSSDEAWTARKIVRRMLWHERDHIGQIAQLIGQMQT